jgi:hypothetical protein
MNRDKQINLIILYLIAIFLISFAIVFSFFKISLVLGILSIIAMIPITKIILSGNNLAKNGKTKLTHVGIALIVLFIL